MSEPRKKVPITELPIRVFKEIGGKGQHLAFIDAGEFHLTFLAGGALEAKRKARTWVQEQHDKLQGRKKKPAGGGE